MKPRLPPTKQNMDLSLMRRPVYILVAIGGWLLNWGLYIPLFYLPPFAITAGLNEKLAPHTVAIFNAVSIFGRVFAGALADRMGCVSIFFRVSTLDNVTAITSTYLSTPTVSFYYSFFFLLRFLLVLLGFSKDFQCQVSLTRVSTMHSSTLFYFNIHSR